MDVSQISRKQDTVKMYLRLQGKAMKQAHQHLCYEGRINQSFCMLEFVQQVFATREDKREYLEGENRKKEQKWDDGTKNNVNR